MCVWRDSTNTDKSQGWSEVTGFIHFSFIFLQVYSTRKKRFKGEMFPEITHKVQSGYSRRLLPQVLFMHVKQAHQAIWHQSYELEISLFMQSNTPHALYECWLSVAMTKMHFTLQNQGRMLQELLRGSKWLAETWSWFCSLFARRAPAMREWTRQIVDFWKWPSWAGFTW